MSFRVSVISFLVFIALPALGQQATPDPVKALVQELRAKCLALEEDHKLLQEQLGLLENQKIPALESLLKITTEQRDISNQQLELYSKALEDSESRAQDLEDGADVWWYAAIGVAVGAGTVIAIVYILPQ